MNYPFKNYNRKFEKGPVEKLFKRFRITLAKLKSR